MLFLSSLRGMGITPIIKLSVVNGAFVPLLFRPHFRALGTNESHFTHGVVDLLGDKRH
jgi:hypothetical protein